MRRTGIFCVYKSEREYRYKIELVHETHCVFFCAYKRECRYVGLRERESQCIRSTVHFILCV